MEFGTIAGLLAVSGVIATHALLYVLGRRRGRAFRQGWRDAARVSGLSDVEVDAYALKGRSAPLHVRLTVYGEPVRVAAAAALGRVGSASAESRLRQAEGESRDPRRAARQAIAEIQARLAGAAGASVGQLSLSDGAAGQVSLADDSSGRLSLPDESGSKGRRRRAARGDAQGSSN